MTESITITLSAGALSKLDEMRGTRDEAVERLIWHTPHRSKSKELTGERYGQLLVLGVAPKAGNEKQWLCRCDCGRTEPVRQGRLLVPPGSPRQKQRIDRCSACRVKLCRQCGALMRITRGASQLCSDACRTARRAEQNTRACRIRDADPERSAARLAQQREANNRRARERRARIRASRSAATG